MEYGGDPQCLDYLAYFGRSFDWSGPDWVDKHLTCTRNPQLTSFGNISIQVRRAIETLGYNESSMSMDDYTEIIGALGDPVTNIYICAAHLSDLRNIDYSDISAKEMTDEQIIVIAIRYNRGPELTLDEIKKGTQSYGEGIR